MRNGDRKARSGKGTPKPGIGWKTRDSTKRTGGAFQKIQNGCNAWFGV